MYFFVVFPDLFVKAIKFELYIQMIQYNIYVLLQLGLLQRIYLKEMIMSMKYRKPEVIKGLHRNQYWGGYG